MKEGSKDGALVGIAGNIQGKGDSEGEQKAPVKQQSFISSFNSLASSRIDRLKLTILGNYYYTPQNTFKQSYKQKIFSYLQAKYMTIISQLEDEKPKKFTSFDPSYGEGVQFRDLRHMKEVILKLKTHIEAGQDAVRQGEIGVKNLKASFLNQAAYEFGRQKRSSIGWGLVLAAVICSTVYRRGSNARKAALFVTCGHLFGQTAYHWNLDKYFDTVYPVFEEDALEFVEQQQKQRIKQDTRKPEGSVIQQ